MSERSPVEARAREQNKDLKRALGLFGLTLLCTLSAGAVQHGREPYELWTGYDFALPLLAILLCHEMGHYVLARHHGVDVSPPFFIPVPVPLTMIGTMGAVIRMREPVRQRNALLDIGAAGPLCGLIVAIPVLIYGLSISPVQPVLPDAMLEGHSLFYAALIWLVKGPIPEGHDVFLSAPAFAGWVGLLVTMMNLVPSGQLDGGHVAYALLGQRQDLYSRYVRRGLLAVGLVLSLGNGVHAKLQGLSGDALQNAELAGLNWMIWGVLLSGMARLTGDQHPPVEPSELSPLRRLLGYFTLVWFVLLFMPTWFSMS